MALISTDVDLLYTVINYSLSDNSLLYNILYWDNKDSHINYNVSELLYSDNYIEYHIAINSAYVDVDVAYSLQLSADYLIDYSIVLVDGLIAIDTDISYNMNYYPYYDTSLLFDLLDHNNIHTDCRISYHLYSNEIGTLQYAYLND